MGIQMHSSRVNPPLNNGLLADPHLFANNVILMAGEDIIDCARPLGDYQLIVCVVICVFAR